MNFDASPRSRLFRPWMRCVLPEAIAAGFTLALMAGAITPLDGYDWLRMHLWHKLAYQSAWLTGEFHHWNPFVSMGRPAAAEIEAAFFYPLNGVFLLGPGWGLLLSIWVHGGLLLRGMVRFMRTLGSTHAGAWMAATTFALGAALVGRLQSGQIQVFCTLAWLPWLLIMGRALVRRPELKTALGLAGVLALGILAGSPPMMWIMGWALAGSMIVTGLTESGRGALPRIAGWSLGALVFAIALSAVAVLPFLELVAWGNRRGDNLDYALATGMAGESWWSLIRSRPGEQFFYWEFNVYGGIIALLLAIWGTLRGGRYAIGWWVLGALFAALATGANSPLLPALMKIMPGWDAWRYPSRYAIITAFAIALLAGRGLDALLSTQAGRWRGGVGLAVGVIGLNTIDLVRAFGERRLIYSDRAPLETEAHLSAWLTDVHAPGRPPPRVLAPNWIVRENAGTGLGFSSLSGFANPALAPVWFALHHAAGLAPDPQDPVNLPNPLYATDPERFEPMALELVWDPAAEALVAVDSPGPRAWMEAGQVTWRLFTPDRIELRVNSESGGELVVAEPWYPGWSAAVGGEPQAIARSHGWMRAVPVPPGEVDVVMTYRSTWFTTGLILSLGAVGTWLVLAWTYGVRNDASSSRPK